MQRNRITVICANCGQDFLPAKLRQKFCNRACANAHRLLHPERSVEERFWAKILKLPEPDGCWLWTAATCHGYGVLTVSTGERKFHLKAHRFSWELVNGPIPAGMEACHSCDVLWPDITYRRCCRPDHLFLGTHRENMRDMSKKGRVGALLHPDRLPRGEHHGNAKLTAAEVIDIRRRFAAGEPRREIAARFKISRIHVNTIVRGDVWAHLLEPAQPGQSSIWSVGPGIEKDFETQV